MEVDNVIDRVGVSRTHKWTLFVLCSVEVLIGFQTVMVSLIAPHLKNEWNLADEVEDIPLSLYLGIIVGSLVSGSLANQMGRKPALLIGLAFQVLGSFLIIISHRFLYFLSSLFGLGVGIGICLITGSALLSEQYPQKYRGRALLFLSFIAIVGKFLAVLFTYIQETQHWRNSQYMFCFFGFVNIILVGWKIPESIRILLVKGEISRCLNIVSTLLKEQNKPDMSLQEVRKLSMWAAQNQKMGPNEATYREIFNKKMHMKTIMLSLTWFIVNFLFNGQLFIMPFVFQKEAGGIGHFAQMICGEIPSIFLTSNMIERERLGRRNSLAIFFGLAALFNLGLIYYENIILIALSRLAIKSIFQILYPYTAESYSTRSRSHGLAFCAGIGRLGSMIMPMLIFPLFQLSSYFVFVAFMGASMIGLFSSLSGHETLNRGIDDISLELEMDEAVKLNLKEQIEHR